MRILARLLKCGLLIVMTVTGFCVQAKDWVCTKYKKYPIILEQTCDRLEGCRYPVTNKAVSAVNLYERPSENAKTTERLERCERMQDFVPYVVIKKPGLARVITSGNELTSLGVKKNDTIPLLQTLADAWVSVCIGNKTFIVYETLSAADLVPSAHEDIPIYENSAFVKIIKPTQLEHWAGLKTPRGKSRYAKNAKNSEPPSFYLNDHSDGKLFCPGDKMVPPKVYIDKGACPFECCTYRDWQAEGDVQLYNDLTERKIVGTVKRGGVVKALTGEVHVVPTKVQVVYNHGKYKAGDQLYLLTNVGEGLSRTWFNGALDEEEVLPFYSGDPNCKKPSEECWAELEPKEQGESIWWVKVQQKDGTIGWTDSPDSFENKDACG